MKRIDLDRYLREQGCVPYREGRGHFIWLNPSQRKSPVSLVIAVRAICKQFEIPQPWGHSHLLLVVGYLALSKDYLGRSVILSNITRKLCCSTA